MPLLLVAGMRAARSPEVVSVTSAPASTSTVVASRRRWYLVLQVTRTVAFVAAVFVPLPLVVRDLLLGVSAVVSFVAVTTANAPRPSPGAARPPGPPARKVPVLGPGSVRTG